MTPGTAAINPAATPVGTSRSATFCKSLFRDAAAARLNPNAPVTGFIGYWAHSAEMTAKTRLPQALARFALIPAVRENIFGAIYELAPPPVDCVTGEIRR